MSDIGQPAIPMPANMQQGFSTADIIKALSPGVQKDLLLMDIQAAGTHHSLPKISDLDSESGILENGLQKLGQLADKKPLYNEFSTSLRDIQTKVAALSNEDIKKLEETYAEIKALQKTIRSQKVSPSADTINMLRGKTNDYRSAAELYKTKYNAIQIEQFVLRSKLSRNTTLDTPSSTLQIPTLGSG